MLTIKTQEKGYDVALLSLLLTLNRLHSLFPCSHRWFEQVNVGWELMSHNCDVKLIKGMEFIWYKREFAVPSNESIKES